MAGGITSMQVLPGSLNAIGKAKIPSPRVLYDYNEYITAGQAFMMKLRKTAEHSPTSMIIEPPQDINGSYSVLSDHPRWRYLKCVVIYVLYRHCIDTDIDNPWGRMSALLVIVWI